MGYTKTNWQTGDIITAEKLNKLENGVVNASGFEVSFVTLTEENITSSNLVDDIYGAAMTYSSWITADAITVTFDGTDYVCSKVIDTTKQTAYGGIDAESTPNFPFGIMSENGENMVVTETEGEHSIKIVIPNVVTTSDFDMGVNAAVMKEQPLIVTCSYSEGSGVSIDATYEIISKAFMDGRMIIASDGALATRNIHRRYDNLTGGLGVSAYILDFSTITYENDLIVITARYYAVPINGDPSYVFEQHTISA